MAGMKDGGNEVRERRPRARSLEGHGYDLAFYSERDESCLEGLNLV